jgi:hypothetical protein
VKPDLELESWRAQWQAEVEVPVDLRRKVAHGTRNMRLMVALEVLVTVAVGGGFTEPAVVDPRAENLVLAGAVWLFLAAAWIFAIYSRRGTWSPSAPTTAEFVDLSIRRCRTRLTSLRFGLWLYFAEMVFCLTWLYRDPARRVPGPAIIFAVLTPIFLFGMAWYRRRTQAELQRLLDLTR